MSVNRKSELGYYMGIVAMFIIATGVIGIPFFMIQSSKDYDHIEQGYIIAKQQEIDDDNTIHNYFKLRHSRNMFVENVVSVNDKDYKAYNIDDLYTYDNKNNRGKIVALNESKYNYSLVYETKDAEQYEVILSAEEYNKYNIGDQYNLRSTDFPRKRKG